MKNFIFILLFVIFWEPLLGQPGHSGFFPISVWLQSPSRAQSYKDAGVNLFIGLWNELDQAQLDNLRKAGMYVICRQNEFGLSLKGDTTVVGWMHDDEPDNAQWNEETQKYDPCIDPAEIIEYYNSVKSKDGSRPVYLNLGRGVSDIYWKGRGACTGKTDLYKESNNGYIAGCDIVSFDIYPVNDKDTNVSEKLWYVPKGIDSLRNWSSKPKPTWCWIETTKIADGNNRQPTPDEVRSEVWMAIVHGATGIGYFCHSWTPKFDEAALLHDSVMIEAVKNLNETIAALAPVLNSPAIVDFCSETSSVQQIPIDMMVKYYDGCYYIFAVSMRKGKTTGTFTVPVGTEVEAWGEDRPIDVSGGEFTDDFTDYQVHIYKARVTNAVNDDNRKNSYIQIFPNPAGEYIEIRKPSEGSEPSEGCNVRIYNTLGQCVMESSTGEVSGSRRICIEKLPPGQYYAKISNNICSFIVIR